MGTDKFLDGSPRRANMAKLSAAYAAGWLGEMVCGLLVAFGLLTRVAAFVASGEMAVAFFMMHAPKAASYLREQRRTRGGLLFRFFYIFLHGSGGWSLDAMMRKETATSLVLRNSHPFYGVSL